MAMQRAWARLRRDKRGAVAPTVALSLFALIACGGIAFDYAHMAALDTELQDAADQAALAGATQLDHNSGAVERATAAAQSLLANKALFANDSNASGTAVTIPTVMFYTSKDDAENNTNGFTDVTRFAEASYVRVAVAARKAVFALTPIVGALNSGNLGAEAVAGVGSAICKVPPTMMCNPAEPSTNANENLDYNPAAGTGLRLVTGDASAPGNFGWLDAGIANGTPALAAALGYNNPPGDCQAITGVTTKTGMDASVLDAFNSRFDIYANGNNTCPSQGGGTCSPARNTRKDLVCNPNSAKTGCTNDSWDEATKPYHPASAAALTSNYPSVMGYPKDLCHAVPKLLQTCGIQGSGVWDRDAYFKVNYNWSATEWPTKTGLGASATRYQVYNWELANKTGTGTSGIDIPQIVSANEAAFSYPATGRAGVAAGATQVDRRRLSVAVLNCVALGVKGKTTNVPVPTWLDVFLVEPAANRADKGGSKTLYTDQKDIYVEVIGKTGSGANGSTGGQVVRRDTPYLIK